MATIIQSSSSSSSAARPSNYHLVSDNKIHSSPPTPQPGRVPAARILKCGICLENFERVSLKDLPSYQGHVTPTLTNPLPLQPRIAKRKSGIPILCSYARGQTAQRSHRPIRWTSSLSGGRRVLPEEQALIASASADVDVPFKPKEVLKLGCSLHMDKDHAFCMECSARYIDTQVKRHAWPILCPKERCRGLVDSSVVEMLLGDDAVKWHTLGLEHAIKNKIYCPNLSCGLMIDGDLHDKTKPVNLHCPYCNEPFCAMCLAPAHKGNNCDKRQDKMFENLADKWKWRACPSCHQMVEKISGCNHITCRCNTHFCYRCGSIGTSCPNHF